MSKKLLSYDPVSKTSSWHYYDHSSRKTYIKTEQDSKPILDRNHRLRNQHTAGSCSKKGDYYHFASVPNVVLMEWKQKYDIDWSRKEDLPKIEKLLSGSEYKYLRTVDRI